MNQLATLRERFYLLAQGKADQAANETAKKAQELLAEITAGKIFQALVIILISYAALFVADRLINWLSERVPIQLRLSVKQSLPFWRGLIFAIAGGFILNLFLNLSPSNVLAVTGTVAVALGFAFKDLVSSIIAGILALFERPYQVGDRIEIKDYYGEVIGYGLRGVQIQTPDDNIVTIPHNTIWTEPISSANKGNLEAQIVTNFYFEHAVDIDRVNQILYRVAQTSKYTQLKLPIVVITEERPWGTHFKLKAYPMDARDEFVYKTDLTQRAKQMFARYDIGYPKLPGTISEDGQISLE
ncbi:MAG: mechanosensitive ion channel family protein [Leptolyngbya sp. SIO4C1]|nr:mechanosensitive ion channel family protein [Leptolyngbya sp. SIO4C1]